MAMISCHWNFSNEGCGTSECGKVAATIKALPWLLEKWWPQNTRGKVLALAMRIPVAKPLLATNMFAPAIFFHA